MSTIDPRTADGWETHRQMQLVNGLKATPLQRMRWLEEAIAFAFRAGALPKAQGRAEASPREETPSDSRTGNALTPGRTRPARS